MNGFARRLVLTEMQKATPAEMVYWRAGVMSGRGKLIFAQSVKCLTYFCCHCWLKNKPVLFGQ